MGKVIKGTNSAKVERSKLEVNPTKKNSAITAQIKDSTDSDIESVYALFNEILEYQVDRYQRSILFLDTLRERSDIILEHKQVGLPPVLDFEYETILDTYRNFRDAASQRLFNWIYG